eukprot:s1473_g7.t1
MSGWSWPRLLLCFGFVFLRNITGTKDALLHGRRRYNAFMGKHNRDPKRDDGDAHGDVEIMAISGRNGDDDGESAIDRQCHVIVNGEAWVGRVAVWRYPVMAGSDIEVWEAKAREEVLAEFSEKTGTPLASVSQFREHCTATPTVMVKGRACAMAERAQYAVFKSLSPAASVSQFREHCTATPTVMVKGRACAMAERAQYAVFKSLSPAADGSLILAAKLAQVAHCAYDVPKKYTADAVLALGTRLLQEAGVPLQAERSSTALIEAMHFSLQDPINLLPSPPKFPGRPVVAGMVWLPSREVRLSAAAGAALRSRLLGAQHRDLPSIEGEVERVVLDAVWGVRLSAAAGAALRSRLLGAQHRDLPSIEGEVERVVLDAVWGVLAHRLQNAGSFEMLVLDHAADVLISAASHPGGRRRREIASWSALLDTQLRY